MFRDDAQKRQKGEKVAAYLANEKNTLSHTRRIDARTPQKLGVKALAVEEQSADLQEAFRKVHLTIMMTLDFTDAIKIYENSEGGVLIRQASITLPQQAAPQLS